MSSTPRPVSDRLEDRVLRIVSDLVGELRGQDPPRGIGLGDSLERDLGISSLERVELLVRLERVFGVRLGDVVMSDAETPGDLATAILTADPDVTETWSATRPDPTIAIPAPSAARTIVDALEWHAERNPDRVHIYLRDDDGHETPLTYGDVWREATNVANSLVDRGLGRRDAVAVMLRTERAFFSAFFGVLMAGCVPVPMYPPFRADRIEEYAQRQVRILRNAEAKLMITFAEVERIATVLTGQAPSLDAVVTLDCLTGHGHGPAALPTAHRLASQQNDGEPALIQYTSGSTGQPKGVLLSHANLLANIRALAAGLEVGADDVGVSWLPLYHDMGLIGAWLGSLYVGSPLALMSPLAFLARPSRWLWSLHAHRGTFSAAPNFAFDLCSHRIDDAELEGLDLGAVRVLLNGSEAVRPETLARFIRRFEPYGLSPTAIAPVYGLAECSVGLSAPPAGRGPRIDSIQRRQFQETGRARPGGEEEGDVLQFVSCGRALPGHEIRVVDSEGHRVADRLEGHVQFRGPSATAGYYRNPDATRTLVHSDGWLETGDLGYLINGELFLTGRRKDLIIKAGRNLQPHEAEEVVAGVSGVRKGCVAAFGISDPTRGTERFVIVAETRLTQAQARARLEATIIERVATALGVPPDVIVLSGPGSVLKTSSGKIRRGATRDAYVSGSLTRRAPSLLVQWTRLAFQAGRGHLKRWSRQVSRIAFTGWVATLLVLTGPFVWLTLALGPAGPWVNRLIGRWTRLLFRLARCRVTVVGLDHLRGVGQAVYVANHASFVDPVLIMSVLPIQPRFAVKARLASYPFLGTAIRKAGHIMIEKNDLSQRIEGAGAVLAPLQAGESLFVFPEGTFVAAPGLLPFRLGAFRAAVDTGCPLVPIAIRGTRRMFPADTLRLRRTAVTVTIGRPISPSGTDWPEIVRLRDAAREMIGRESGEAA